jgi:hypothetical protein
MTIMGIMGIMGRIPLTVNRIIFKKKFIVRSAVE